MIVTTVNVNGVRAAVRERSAENLGLLAWLSNTSADVVCLQETRADDEQLAEALAPAVADGWHIASACPHLKGRSGVAVLSRTPFSAVRIGLPATEFELHGRYVEADVGGVTVGSVYVHTGEAGTDRQLEKERFMAALAKRMAELAGRPGRDAVVCGDWNIAHTENDIKAWKANVKKAGFLPTERQWLTDLLESGWVDVMRSLHPEVAGPVQLVVVARQGVRQRRRLAHRLPPGQRGPGRPHVAGAGRTARRLRAAMVRPCTGDRRVRG